MTRAIGRASDFYRLRLLVVDVPDRVDMEWRDDILYRRPPAQELSERPTFRVEAVTLEEDEFAVVLRTFMDEDDALAWLHEVQHELDVLLKAEFEEAYFPLQQLG